jgi:hypothetical protein
MTIGTLVAAAATDTFTTTGTGALTLANAVPAGSAAGSTTLGAAFAPTGVFPQNNIFYFTTNGSDVEVGLGSLTSNTNFTRDHILLVTHAGVQDTAGQPVSWAAGTKTIFSNPNLLATTAALWQRFPNQVGGGDGGYTEDLMSGSFAGVLTDGVGTTAMTIRFKISSAGIVTMFLPTTTVNNTGTALSITGIPAFLSNVTSQSIPCFVTGTTAGGVNVPGIATLAPGATPTSTGTITFQQYTAAAFPALYTAVFTASVVRGVIAQTLTFAAL